MTILQCFSTVWSTLPKRGALNKVLKCRGGEGTVDSYVSCEVFTISCALLWSGDRTGDTELVICCACAKHSLTYCAVNLLFGELFLHSTLLPVTA